MEALSWHRAVAAWAIEGRRKAGQVPLPALTDALGNLVGFCLMPGHAHDLRETDTLICELSTGHLLADKAFDADWLRNALPDRGIPPVIPPKSNRKLPAEFDKETCKWRHLIEKLLRQVEGQQKGSPCAPARQTRASKPSSPLRQQSLKSDERQRSLNRLLKKSTLDAVSRT